MADATRHSRRISPGTRRVIFERSDGRCQRCSEPIDLKTFHVAHLRAASHGGPAIESNLQAWCPPCNIKNGNRDVGDTRTPLRPWQEEALPIVLDALTMQRMATVMAAPGAGKTVFAGAMFVAGQEAGLWQRLLVLVPRLPLVEQWKDALLHEYHIALDIADGARQSGLEMHKMDGVCNTYQALLSPQVRERHRYAVQNTPTLVVLDEVHHLGQLVRDEDDAAAWASAVRELAGDIRTGLNVAGVLNLSGTLFRTSPKERISTVAYENVVGKQGEDRIQAIANYTMHADRLVREGLLRAPDLFRVGANVEIVNLKTEEVTVSAIADLDEDEGDARLVLRRLNNNTEWVAQLVRVTLDELARRHRDGKNAPVKALIVAHRQDMARLFEKEVNFQMKNRGLQPLAECVVSDDGPDAYKRLKNFRLMNRVGVLCTVGMAGEGYDCPDIAVVTYATNVLTAQYIRQVVARGQRVTKWEREKVGHPLSTAIILPDVQQLVEHFRTILAPMVHDIEIPLTPAARDERQPQGDGSGLLWNDRDLVAVRDAALEVVSAVSSTGTFDVDPALADLLTPILRDVNLPESSWPRVAQVIDLLNHQRPFQPTVSLGSTSSVAVEEPPATTRRPLTPREHHDVIRRRLTLASGWWAQFPAKQGRQPVAHFMSEIYRQTGIKKLDDATPEQLKRAVEMALSQIQNYCDQSRTPLPKWFRTF
jgi:superfamily II DNA or RNA helicase